MNVWYSLPPDRFVVGAIPPEGSKEGYHLVPTSGVRDLDFSVRAEESEHGGAEVWLSTFWSSSSDAA